MPENTIPLEPEDARYLEQLNIELLYAQKAYMQALAYLRRRYEATDEQVWAMNNIGVGFERVTNGVA